MRRKSARKRRFPDNGTKMEKGIRWDDDFLAINWKEEKAIISDKDMNQPSFKELFEKV